MANFEPDFRRDAAHRCHPSLHGGGGVSELSYYRTIAFFRETLSNRLGNISAHDLPIWMEHHCGGQLRADFKEVKGRT